MTANPADRVGAILEVDLAGIAANWRLLARRVDPAGCAAVVKADAYGLGAALVAPALAAGGCRRFFVATIDEGIALRKVLPESAEIAVLNGLLPGCVDDFIEFRLVPVLNDPWQIADWRSAAARHGKGPAMVHIDTGMGRLGLTVREFDQLAEELCRPDPIEWRRLERQRTGRKERIRRSESDFCRDGVRARHGRDHGPCGYQYANATVTSNARQPNLVAVTS